MELITQLRVLKVFSGVGLILTLVVFSSPGWVILIAPINDIGNSQILTKGNSEEKIPPTSLVPKADDSYIERHHSAETKKLHSPHVQQQLLRKNETSTVCLHAGLWFFVTCVREHTDQRYRTGQQCHFSTYEKASDNVPKLSTNTIWLKRVYEKIGVTSKLGLLEFRFEATLGLVFSFVGFVSMILYKKNNGETRGSGIIACLSFFLSGGMIWTAVGKVATSIAQVQIIFGSGSLGPFQVPVPWCLITGAISATFTLASAIGLIFVLSRDRKKDYKVVETYNVKSSLPYHTLQ